MLSAFKRLTQGVLSLTGEDSFLRGTIPCKVNIEHGVQFGGDGSEAASYRGEVVLEKSVATFDKLLLPMVGDELSHPDGNYVLDTKAADNGYSIRYILRPIV